MGVYVRVEDGNMTKKEKGETLVKFRYTNR